MFGRSDDYRVPDLTIAAPEHVSARGIEGKALLVIEILSPNDESRDKLPWYARLDVREVWLIDPRTRELELHVLWGTSLRRVEPEDGVLRSVALGIELRIVDGPRLELRWDDETATI